MPDYSKGKIYSIRSPNTEEIYIGSTVQPLTMRFHGHLGHYKMYLDKRNNFTSSFKILEKGDAYIELIENFPCNSKEELNKREGEVQREYKNRVNKNIAGRTTKEFYKEYYQKNKPIYTNLYRKNIPKIRLFYKNNRERLLQRCKERYDFKKKVLTLIKECILTLMNEKKE
jgi:hypothetical protein